MRRQLAAAIVMLLCFVIPVKAEEPIDSHRYVRAHFLDAQLFTSHQVKRIRDNYRRHSQHHRAGKRTHAYAARKRHHYSAALDPQSPAPLNAKVQEILTDCGSRIASGYRPGARAGWGLSNHALHRAYDVAENPRCIYAHLKGWPGGYSTDYANAPGGSHVHISYNPHKEWGIRFVHHNPFLRYAMRHRRVQ